MTDTPSLLDYLAALPQHLYPQRLLSRLMWRAARVRAPWVKDRLIRGFIRRYGVDMAQALDPDPASYPDFNRFFTRALGPDARVLPGTMGPEAGAVVSPADGRVSALGLMDAGRLVQAKGHEYTVAALLQGNAADAQVFMGGRFLTVYLSPRDYHRVHMPIEGRLRAMRYVPGRRFSVNARTTRVIPRLFARNERVILLFDTQVGPMALVMVGAILVGSIGTVWAGTVTPRGRPIPQVTNTPPENRQQPIDSHGTPHGRLLPRAALVHTWRYDEGGQAELTFARGQEIGRFNMGSTVILLLPPDSVTWAPSLSPGTPVRMGMVVGSMVSGPLAPRSAGGRTI